LLEVAKAAGAVTVNYGLFINSVVNFIIVAFAVFLLVKQINRLRRQAPAAAPTERPCQFCQMNVPIKAVRCPHCTSQLAA
jgi:large conductance mechanosensitive channel